MTADIAIVGAGPSGLALAALLEKSGISYITYERSKKDAPPYGGCLDLHANGGQRAIKDAGLFDEFKKYARYGDATIHSIFNHLGEKAFQFGEGRDAPEIDRADLRKVLLAGIPDEKVCWSKALQSADRDDNGQVVLSFTDGTTASGFKLVVGADGTFSKVRPLVTSAKPVFANKLYITTEIHPSNPFYSKMEALAGMGAMIVAGKGVHMFNSRQGDGHYRVDIGLRGPEDFATSGIVDLTSHDTAKESLLREDKFGSYAPEIQEIIRQSDGPFRPWMLYYMPTERLNWSPAPGVTLIGDAAHVSTPFVGDGANCAMRDSIILCDMLKEHGITQEAIAAYEKEMFPHGIDIISRSLLSGEMFFEEDSPKRFLDIMNSGKALIGSTDNVLNSQTM